jgi:FtsZ-binding cell division protein ZapB
MELNREQIVKALDCFHKRILDTNLAEMITETEMMSIIDTITLINELTEENERLRAEKEVLEINNKDLKYRNKELTAFNRRWAKECAELQDECDQIKAGAVRKMQERLKSRKVSYGNTTFMVVHIDDIDQIAKEMLEDNDG